MPSVVIIGSGISGLTSAVLLAEHGWKVTVLEAHGVPGGLMQRFRRGPYWFDTGFHFLTGSAPGGVFRQLARRLGVLERVRFLPLDERAQFRVHFDGEPDFDVPVGLDETRLALTRRWPDQGAGIARFFEELASCMKDSKWLSGMVPSETRPGTVDPMLSVGEVLTRCGVQGEAAEAIGLLTAILAMRPETCPLASFAGFAGTALAGSYRAEGGGEAVTRPLIERLQELGGTLVTNCGAARIHWNEREVTEVEDRKGVRHAAELVISTCHPAELLRLTGPGGLRPSLEKRIRETPDSASAVLLFAALSCPPLTLGCRHHIARFGKDSELYYLAPSNFRPSAESQAEHPLLEAMIWVPCDSVDAWRDSNRGDRPAAYEAWKRAREAEILAELFALHPELEGTIERVWSSTPLSIQHYVRSRNGAAMGLSHDIGHFGTEPFPHRSRLKNLLFAGQNVGHPGVIGCMIGAFILAEMILAKDLCSEVLAGQGPTR
jgi:all-trans-retinol 13,14-reductase